MPNKYAELKQIVEAAGFFTTAMPLDAGGNRLVCASKRFPDGQALTGNSFWVAKRDSGWYLGVWSGLLYRFPDGNRVAEMCIAWLKRASDATRFDIDDHIRHEFKLVSVSDEEFYNA